MRPISSQLLFAAVLVFIYLIFGTWFFSWQEHWRTFDAFYFSAMTLTTVGYGDFTPHTDISKLVTVFYAFSGISIIFYSLSLFAREYFDNQERRFEKITNIPRRIMQHTRFRRMQTLQEIVERSPLTLKTKAPKEPKKEPSPVTVLIEEFESEQQNKGK